MNNQILQFVQHALQQGKDPQEIMQMLVQQGVPEEQAMQILQQVSQPQMQKGGKFREHGYDAIHPSMYAQMQKLADEMYFPKYPSQEETSQMLAELPLKEVTWITDQRRKLAKKALPTNVYNYAQQHLMQTPQLRRLVNPQTVLANQTYQNGGMTDAEAKVFYKNPRYVQSVVDAEQNSFIGPSNYPVTEMPIVNDADYGYDDSPVFVDPESMASVTSKQQSVPAFVSKPRVLKKQMSKAELMRKSNKEYANIADQRMKSTTPIYNVTPNVYNVVGKSSPTIPFQGDRTNSTSSLKGRGVEQTPLGSQDFLAMSTFVPLGEGVSLGLKGISQLPKVVKAAKTLKKFIKNPYLSRPLKRLANDITRTESRFEAARKLVPNPGATQAQITSYVNMLKKVGQIETNQLKQAALEFAKNPTQLKKLNKMINQTKNLGLE